MRRSSHAAAILAVIELGCALPPGANRCESTGFRPLSGVEAIAERPLSLADLPCLEGEPAQLRLTSEAEDGSVESEAIALTPDPLGGYSLPERSRFSAPNGCLGGYTLTFELVLPASCAEEVPEPVTVELTPADEPLEVELWGGWIVSIELLYIYV